MQLIIESDSAAVRVGLARLLATDMITTMQDGARGTAEIVLAEVLNNIVEHAYNGQAGDIIISLQHRRNGVLVQVRDHGEPFPRDEVPHGLLPEADTLGALPEGGFGWYLIRRLVDNLTYFRKDGCNHLSFFLSYEDKV